MTKYIALLAATILAGVTTAACTTEVSTGRPQTSYHNPNSPRGDADRDGVPNRYDRRPDNPYRS